jgi:hypothetical protein
MKQVKVMLVAVTQVLHKKQIKQPQVSQDTITITKNRNTMCILLNRIYYTGCPTRYQTWHFFNNFTTNEDTATKFEADLPHCVRNMKEKNVLVFKFCCNIFIDVRIIKEMLGSVASGTPCIYDYSEL